MIMKSKYPNDCPLCDEPIHVGERIVWQPGLRAYHVRCRDEWRAVPLPDPDLTRVFPCQFDESPLRTGEVIAVGSLRYLTVAKTWRYRYRSDGGVDVGHDRGDVLCADCRPSTDEEICDMIQEQRLNSYFDALEGADDEDYEPYKIPVVGKRPYRT